MKLCQRSGGAVNRETATAWERKTLPEAMRAHRREIRTQKRTERTAPSFFDMLSDAEREIIQRTPLGSRAALEHEMQILKFREHKILAKIAEYEAAPEDSLYINSLMDMRVPGGRGKDKQDGALQSMGMYSKDSAFSRVLKLQEALYKVQGRIAKIADSLRALEESEKRMTLEREKLELLRMRATGAVDVPDPETDGEDAEEMA